MVIKTYTNDLKSHNYNNKLLKINESEHSR
jgi:hypothetical protein